MDLLENLTNTKEINLEVKDVVNQALDFGLKTILPDFIEDDIIEIKNTFIEEGFTEGIQETLDKLEDVGKSITGIFTGKFETVEQIKRLIKTDGILDTASSLIDKILKKMLSDKKISKSTYNLIKTGKKEILNSLEDELEDYYKENEYDVEKLSEYCQEWKENYKSQNYSEMEKSMKKINKKLEKSEVIEKVINEARNIEKIQEYIQEKGGIDKLTEDEKALLENLN